MTEEQKAQLKKEFDELAENVPNYGTLPFQLSQIKESTNFHIIARDKVAEGGIIIGTVNALANGTYSDVPVHVAKDANGQINTLWGRKPPHSGIKVGDKIFYTNYGGFKIEENGITYDFVYDQDIHGILK